MTWAKVQLAWYEWYNNCSLNKKKTFCMNRSWFYFCTDISFRCSSFSCPFFLFDIAMEHWSWNSHCNICWSFCLSVPVLLPSKRTEKDGFLQDISNFLIKIKDNQTLSRLEWSSNDYFIKFNLVFLGLQLFMRYIKLNFFLDFRLLIMKDRTFFSCHRIR